MTSETVPKGNIYLIGFSGTGKSNSGRQAAALLGWEFFEMDDEIELAAGKKIPEIFSEDGEERYFAEVGNGIIDFARIFQARETAGLDYFFVEQDFTQKTPFESIEISIDFLNNADFVYTSLFLRNINSF